MNITTINVQIMGRTFSIQCPESKVKELEESAEYVDKKIHDLALDDQVIHRENVLVIMALNIARELLDQKNNRSQETNYLSLVGQSLRELKAKIDQELGISSGIATSLK